MLAPTETDAVSGNRLGDDAALGEALGLKPKRRPEAKPN